MTFLVRCIAASFTLALALAVPSTSLRAQATATNDYDFVVDVLRTDYAGFPTKTAGDRGADFERLVREQRAVIERDPSSFAVSTRALLGWFQDRHLGLSGASETATSEAAAAAAAVGERLPITEAMARAAFDAAPTSAAGIWRSQDGGYRLAVVPPPSGAGGFVGAILSAQSPNWSAGQVKFAITPDGAGTWWMGDHAEVTTTVHVSRHVMRFVDAGTTLVREYPAPTIDLDRLTPSASFFLRRLSPETLWLRLPDFAAGHRAEIEALLAENDAALRSTPNLIVDLRDNGGGSDSSYEKLMSYLYTRPIYAIGAEVRRSARNLANFDALANNNDLPPASRDLVSQLADKIRASDEEWVPMFKRDVSIRTYPEALPNPRRVGVIGTGTGSSGDQFVIDARFSRKVTLFGGPTAGVIDYSNVAEVSLPSGRGYSLHWPTTRSLRLPEEPFDNVGVPPDVPFGPEVEDPIGAVQAWLEQQSD